MTARENLETFIDRVRTMQDQCTTGKDIFALEFQELKLKSFKYKKEKPCKAGEQEINMRKNRYRDILPYDYTRVKLPDLPDIPGSDYINANFVHGVDGTSKVYIASQGPLPNTVTDYWRMLWHYEVKIIIMSCRNVENGKTKCDKYWPEIDDEKVYGALTVTLKSEKNQTQNVVVREICARMGDEERTFTQYHYQAWPDHGIPPSSLPIINMIKLFRQQQPHDNKPIVIHCSAGCGRTGAIIVLDYVMKLIEMEKIDDSFDLFNLIDGMRRQRPAIVQTKDQYEFVHIAVSELMIQEIQTKYQDYSEHSYENIELEAQNKPEIPIKSAAKQGAPSAQVTKHSYINVARPEDDTNTNKVSDRPVPAARGKKPILPGNKPLPPKTIQPSSAQRSPVLKLVSGIEKAQTEPLVPDRGGGAYERVTPGTVSAVTDQLFGKSKQPRPVTKPPPTQIDTAYEIIEIKDKKEKKQEKSDKKETESLFAQLLARTEHRQEPAPSVEKKVVGVEYATADDPKDDGAYEVTKFDKDVADVDGEEDGDLYAVVESRKPAKPQQERRTPSIDLDDSDLPPALPDRTKESKQLLGEESDETASVSSAGSAGDLTGGPRVLEKIGKFGRALGRFKIGKEKKPESAANPPASPDQNIVPTAMKASHKETFEEVIKTTQKNHVPTFSLDKAGHLGYPNRHFKVVGPRDPPWKLSRAPTEKLTSATQL